MCFMCAKSEGSDEIARMHMLARAFTGRLCDKYHNLTSWFIYVFFFFCFFWFVLL